MIEFKPLMPVYLLVVYLSLASAVLVLYMLSFVAVYRTKKTPYATKLLSLGLLTYDILFLALSSFSKLFDYNDVYPIWKVTRGFQVTAQLILGNMALERLFILNWPYVYLRVANECRTKMVCIAVVVFGHLFGKELFILFAASAFRKLSSIYVFSYFPFGFEGRIWDLIVSVPDHCLSFYFGFLQYAT